MVFLKLAFTLGLLVGASAVVETTFIGVQESAVQDVQESAPAWTVLAKTFSAITIGIGFKDDKTGWTSHTDGSSAVQIVKTTDGGQNWATVGNNTGLHVMTMGVAASKGTGPISNVATTGLASSEYSLDGDTFKTSLVAVLDSQDIEYRPTGRMTIAAPNGPCTSSTGGLFYVCHKVPFKNPGTGRYVSAPSKDVIYVTAGQWPSSSPTDPDMKQMSSNLRVMSNPTDGSRKFSLGAMPLTGSTNGSYTAEIWKSTDGGKNFTSLFHDEGNFYFNDIDCFDDTHCIAVGEGYAADGSNSPGARVYLTTDGVTFSKVHQESTTGKESLMAANMLSVDEHWVGGATAVGGLAAPVLALHSKDGGKSWVNEHGAVLGQMITAMDFVSSSHGYATTVNALQVSSLLEYTANAPTPPPPAPPTPGQTHYGDPFVGCESDEVAVQITGVAGEICSPQCNSAGACPTDVPAGVSAAPKCALKSSQGAQFCVLECTPSENDACGTNASCKAVQGVGLCTYDK